MSSPAKTPCPKCGHTEATTACRFCGISKIKPQSFHDYRDRGDPMEKVDPNDWRNKEEDELWKLGKIG